MNRIERLIYREDGSLRTMKGLPAFRVLAMAAIFLSVFFFAYIGFVGGYQQDNNLPLNSTLAGQFYARGSNAVNQGGILGNLSALSNQSSSQATAFQSAGLPTQIITTITFTAAFLKTLPALLNALLGFGLVPLTALGIPTGFLIGIISMSFLIIMVIYIISAWFLKDI